MRLLLCRHGEDGDGSRLVRALADVRVAAVYTSPLARAVMTADAVAAVLELTPCVVADLREIERGGVDGLQFEEYPAELQHALLHTPGAVRFPNGESYADLQRRVVGAIDEIVCRHDGETVVAVSHAGAIRAALSAWLAVPPDAAFRMDQSFGSVNVIDWTEGVPFVRLVNGATMPPALRAAQ